MYSYDNGSVTVDLDPHLCKWKSVNTDHCSFILNVWAVFPHCVLEILPAI